MPGPVTCQSFRKNDDGSWISILTTDIATPTGSIRIPAGMTFVKGKTLLGEDVAGLLEKNCP